jgi:tetratricopeptide (TPR) repeat protein
VRCNLALGLWYLQRGEATAAVRHLERAVTAATRLDANPRDHECFYALGLGLRFAGDLHGAYEAFGKATWDRTWQPAAFLAMAEIDATRGDVPAALAALDKALLADGEAAAARDLRAALLRRAGRHDEARALAAEALVRDPLDAWAANERRLLDGTRDRGDGAQGSASTLAAGVALDVAHDYARAGLLDDALDILEGPFDPRRDPGALPMVHYTRGWLHERAGDDVAAARARATARALPTDHVFPARTEDIVVLRTAMAADPTDGRAAQYLGNLLYDRRRYREAIAAWRTAVRLEPSLATAQRNLGIAEYDRLGRPDRAVARYERAMRADPSDARLLFELDQLRKRIGVAPSDRLSALIAREDLVEARDDLSLELVTLLNRLGRHEDALAILTRRRFHPWEGGEGQVTGQWRIANRELGRAALRAGRAAAATDRFMAAAEYPANLGEGKHPLLAENEIHHLIGRAAAAAGDTAARTRWYERAAERQGDTSAPLDVADYWRALALRALGDEEAATGVLTALLRVGRQRARTGDRVDHFATSLPDFLVFQRPEPGRGRVPGLYLMGLARQGLGDPAGARRMFQQALGLAVDHLESALRLEELRATDHP